MVNLIPIPSCLNKNLIEKWFLSFGELLFGLNKKEIDKLFMQTYDIDIFNSESELYADAKRYVRVEPALVFSDDVELREYPNIIEEIFDTWPNLSDNAKKQIKELIKENIEDVTYLYEAISGIICEDLDLDYDSVSDEVTDILKTSVYLNNNSSFVVLGKYLPSANVIVLYVKAIEDAAKHSKNTLLQIYEEVFVHELLHWFNYALMKSQGLEDELMNRFDYTASVVKESLAAFYEHEYCLNNNIKPEFWDDIRKNTPSAVRTPRRTGCRERCSWG